MGVKGYDPAYHRPWTHQVEMVQKGSWKKQSLNRELKKNDPQEAGGEERANAKTQRRERIHRHVGELHTCNTCVHMPEGER